MRNCGLVSVSFRDKTPKKIVEAVKRCNLTQIEWGSDIHAPADDTDKLEQIVSLCKTNSIGISSYGTYFKIGRDDPAKLETYIRAAEILGTKIIRLWCGTKGFREYDREALDGLLAECRGIASIAKKAGVTVCMECHNHTVTDCAEGAMTLMSEVGCESFGLYWQPNQYKTPEENLQYAALAAPYTKIIHVFNWQGSEKRPLGDAVGIWRRYLGCFSEDIPLLLEFMPDGKIESLKREAEALAEIVGNPV